MTTRARQSIAASSPPIFICRREHSIRAYVCRCVYACTRACTDIHSISRWSRRGPDRHFRAHDAILRTEQEAGARPKYGRRKNLTLFPSDFDLIPF